MARGVDCVNGGSFNFKQLSIQNGLLISTWAVLINRRRQMRIETDQIRNTSSVIAMPMCEEHVGKSDRKIFERGGDKIGPFRNALTSINDQS